MSTETARYRLSPFFMLQRICKKLPVAVTTGKRTIAGKLCYIESRFLVCMGLRKIGAREEEEVYD